MSTDNPMIPFTSRMIGWWQVVAGGKTQHYNFAQSGVVRRTANKPLNCRAHPPGHCDPGYWFQNALRVSI
jgi:hypothetical protein